MCCFSLVTRMKDTVSVNLMVNVQGDRQVFSFKRDSLLFSRLVGRFQPLQLNRPQFLMTHSCQLTDSSIGNVGLEIEWRQRWMGTRSLLMTARPRCLFTNKSSVDLTIIYGARFCLLQRSDSIISPDGLSVSATLIGFCCRNQLRSRR